MNYTMMTDFYEFTMAQTYYDKGEVNKKVYFDIFYRKNPFNGGYAISGGLDNIIEFVNNFKITDRDIEFLRKQNKFSEEFLKYLRNLKFTGDIYSVPDGTVIFPNEPIISIRANVIEAQLLETALLSEFNHGTLVTTAAKRITAAAGDKPVMEFGARRARGKESAIEASKYAYVGGCAGTSNVYAGMEYDIPVMGTMAHSMICDADSEYEAFLNYAKSNPYDCVFLVDTFDTLRSGIPNAIKVAREYLVPNGYPFKGIRIDSGDLSYLAKEARKMLDEAGFPDAKICVSNGLTEAAIIKLIEEGAPIDSIGAGDNIAASKERVGGVYKLVAVEKDGNILPRIKVSEDTIKTINPGYKKVYRFYDKKTGFALGDVIALDNEVISKDKYTLVSPTETWKTTELENYNVRCLQEHIFANGKQIYDLPNIEERRKYCTEEFATIYPEIKRVENYHEYYVDLTNKLRTLKEEMIMDVRANKVKKKVR